MVCEILKHWKKSRIELDYLQQQCRGISYEDFAVLIRECMEKGILLPIKSAGRDGGGLPYKFSIARGKLLGDNVAYINNIVQAGEFSSLLSFSWYYEQPLKIWEGELPYIRLLDAYLKHEQKIVPAGIQQRSFEIFKNEKWLLEHGDFLGHAGFAACQWQGKPAAESGGIGCFCRLLFTGGRWPLAADIAGAHVLPPGNPVGRGFGQGAVPV